jgi:hypothetical protein
LAKFSRCFVVSSHVDISSPASSTLTTAVLQHGRLTYPPHPTRPTSSRPHNPTTRPWLASTATLAPATSSTSGPTTCLCRQGLRMCSTAAHILRTSRCRCDDTKWTRDTSMARPRHFNTQTASPRLVRMANGYIPFQLCTLNVAIIRAGGAQLSSGNYDRGYHQQQYSAHTSRPRHQSIGPVPGAFAHNTQLPANRIKMETVCWNQY